VASSDRTASVIASGSRSSLAWVTVRFFECGLQLAGPQHLGEIQECAGDAGHRNGAADDLLVRVHAANAVERDAGPPVPGAGSAHVDG
jgi:hypothetical protein